MKIAYILPLLILVACTPTVEITSFEECIAAGNPAMESYPRQCRANGETFVEDVPIPVEPDGGIGDGAGPIPEMRSPEYTACDSVPEVCTMDYRPTCGLVDNGVRCITEPCPSVDAQTFSNGCGACAGQAYGWYEGACVDQRFVVCAETFTGFNATEFANNVGGICVDICLGNYDSYMTQIGVEMCIPHYGKEEISSWNTCTESSDSCECVKAIETTANEEISDAQYRCVPEQYAERMLFRSGVDRLDENGEQSVMIA